MSVSKLANDGVVTGIIVYNKQLKKWESLNKDKNYTVAVNDWLSTGGDGFTMLKNSSLVNEVTAYSAKNNILTANTLTAQFLRAKSSTITSTFQAHKKT